MPLNIKNEEADRLARELTIDLPEELLEIGRRCAALPVLDPRSADEIIGYDEHGSSTSTKMRCSAKATRW